MRRILALRDDPPLEIVLWDGTAVRSGAPAPVARLHLRQRAALYGLLLHPELAFGDAYSAGSLDVEGDLVRVLELLYRAPERRNLLTRLLVPLQHLLRRRNTRRGSQQNVHHHYDLGNDFYSLWLDERMVYTCAYFPDPEAALEEAQLAKLDHVCRKLWLRPGERVVEAGCGWGALALHMARHYGVSVTACNISREQVQYAQERARREGLAGRVEFVADDWRNLRGRWDAFVSVGMLEHVGRERYGELGRVIDACLGPDGRGLLHSIGRVRPRPMNAWIERRIFPGSYAPTLGELMEVLEPADLAVLDVENLRLHYARTLEHWLERFEKQAEPIARRFDERFVRAWRLYLAGSIASFETSSLQLFQVLFARARCNELPWTRAHLYAGGSARPAAN